MQVPFYSSFLMPALMRDKEHGRKTTLLCSSFLWVTQVFNKISKSPCLARWFHQLRRCLGSREQPRIMGSLRLSLLTCIHTENNYFFSLCQLLILQQFAETGSSFHPECPRFSADQCCSDVLMVCCHCPILWGQNSWLSMQSYCIPLQRTEVGFLHVCKGGSLPTCSVLSVF